MVVFPSVAPTRPPRSSHHFCNACRDGVLVCFGFFFFHMQDFFSLARRTGAELCVPATSHGCRDTERDGATPRRVQTEVLLIPEPLAAAWDFCARLRESRKRKSLAVFPRAAVSYWSVVALQGFECLYAHLHGMKTQPDPDPHLITGGCHCQIIHAANFGKINVSECPMFRAGKVCDQGQITR